MEITDLCVSVCDEHEQDAIDCRDWLTEHDILPPWAKTIDATAYFENGLDGMCDACKIVDGCPVCEKYE